jgi:hypothetical protein
MSEEGDGFADGVRREDHLSDPLAEHSMSKMERVREAGSASADKVRGAGAFLGDVFSGRKPKGGAKKTAGSKRAEHAAKAIDSLQKMGTIRRYAYLRTGPLGAAWRAHCEEQFAMENYNFLKDLDEGRMSDPELIQEYIENSGPQSLNLSYAERKKILDGETRPESVRGTICTLLNDPWFRAKRSPAFLDALGRTL